MVDALLDSTGNKSEKIWREELRKRKLKDLPEQLLRKLLTKGFGSYGPSTINRMIDMILNSEYDSSESWDSRIIGMLDSVEYFQKMINRNPLSKINQAVCLSHSLENYEDSCIFEHVVENIKDYDFSMEELAKLSIRTDNFWIVFDELSESEFNSVFLYFCLSVKHFDNDEEVMEEFLYDSRIRNETVRKASLYHIRTGECGLLLRQDRRSAKRNLFDMVANKDLEGVKELLKDNRSDPQVGRNCLSAVVRLRDLLDKEKWWRFLVSLMVDPEITGNRDNIILGHLTRIAIMNRGDGMTEFLKGEGS